MSYFKISKMSDNNNRKIMSFDQLKKLKEELKNQSVDGSSEDQVIMVKIAMATCSIASGAKEIMRFFQKEIEKRGIKAIIKKTGCMGLCYAEPTVEVTLAGKEPVIFGNVNLIKAEEIIEKFIKNKESIDGVLQIN
jgi:NADP-reducing hydrogenase subunit HndB